MGRRFRIKVERLRSAARQMHDQSVLMVKASYEILEIVQRLRGMPQMLEVCQTLRKVAEESRYESALLHGASNSASQIGAAYDKTENNVYSNADRERQ